MLKKFKVDGLDIMSLMNGLVFFAPVALLVRLDAGISTTQFFILQAFLSIVILVFEIPTGKMTDIIGYRNTMIMSQVMLTFARILLFVSYVSGNYVIFFLEAFVEGIASCFSSGTESSYLYGLYNEDEFVVKTAHVSNFGTAGFIISTIAYAGLYKIFNIEGLLIGTIITSAIGVFTSFTLKKEKVKDAGSEKLRIKSASVKSCFCNSKTILIVVAFSCISIVFVIINFFYVEKLQMIGLDEEFMTIIILGYSIIQLLSEKILDKFTGKYGRLLIGSFVLSGALLICFGFMLNKIAIILIMLILPLLMSIPCFILDEVQNKIIDAYDVEEKRAEMLSVMNMGVNLVEVIFLFQSAIFSKIGISICFFIIGLIIEIISIIIGVMLFKNPKKLIS